MPADANSSPSVPDLQRRVDELAAELRTRSADYQEALLREAAVTEVLQVINSSPSNLTPVFDAMLERALRLCQASCGHFRTFDGELLRVVAIRGVPDAYAEFLRTTPVRPSSENQLGRILRGEQVVVSVDAADEEPYRAGDPLRRAFVDLGGARTAVTVALAKDKRLLGTLTVYRQEVRPFTDKQIALVQNFAAQAVIAMENTRLLAEQREALERQTATTEVLETINRSPGDLQPVFEAILAKAMMLCDAAFGTLATFDSQRLHTMATRGVPEAFTLFRLSNPPDYGPGTGPARLIAGEAYVHDVDAADSEAYRRGDPNRRAIVDLGGARTILNVALRKDDALLGTLSIYRQEVRPFRDDQIALLQGFAAQAVIAMENARLINEQREALDQQTANAEVLQVINVSPGNLAPVFEAILEKAMQVCRASFGGLWIFDAGRYVAAALHNVPQAFAEFIRTSTLVPGPGSGPYRFLHGERSVIQNIDLAAEELYRAGDPQRRALVDLGGARTALQVPLCTDDTVIGVVTIYRQEVQAFDERQIALLQSFAAQAVIAIQNARLLGELRQRTGDLTESLEYQTAISELLEVISRSTTDVQPVFETIFSAAQKLCDVENGGIAVRSGDVFRFAIAKESVAEMAEILLRRTFVIDHTTLIGRVAAEARVVHIEDVRRDAEYMLAETAAIGGVGTMLGVPLMQNHQVVGVIVLTRLKVEPFTERQIALVRTFADQAVIAMENARLLGELTRREEELRVTFDNMGDGVAMFDTEPRLVAWNRNFEEIIGLPDALLAERPSYADYLRMLAERGEFGTENVEAELATRLENTARELRLERTRADGTVIEVRRNAVPGGGFVLIYSDVTEQRRAEAEIRAARDDAEAALERQTATAEILKVIASSPTDVQPVLEAVAKAALQFCGATDATIHLRDGDEIMSAAHDGPLGVSLGLRRPLNRETGFGIAVLDGRTRHVPDVESLDAVHFATTRRLAAQFGFRASVAAPLLREGTAIGALSLRRAEPGPFTSQQIELLETFAAQAVIAIENVRLFTELKESLEQQTATSEILRAISQSPTDVQPVLEAVVRAAVRFCGATDAIISMREGDERVAVAHEGNLGFETRRDRLARDSSSSRAILDAEFVHLPDIQALDAVEFATARRLAVKYGFRASVAAPLLREGIAIGSVTLRKPDPGPFTLQQITLLETFAAQAVIAIENVRLFTELRDSLERLRSAQANLIQSEKMASLGQLTAGIAHEIKNPLNFVNNFAGLSVELLDELKQAAAPVLVGMSEDARAEFGDTIDLITANLEKIAEHGKRADGIVKSMLAHSRGGTGDWQASNINALVEEALNLAYHGARAQDQDFNVTLERDFASDARPIEVVPQDVTRVFLNLFGNGFYAAKKRQLGGTGSDYRPTLTVSTRDLGEAVEIRVRDNGTGIPAEVREKLFQPFFTTKPTGEGTGLGLSISYDIVTQQHGGSIDVESEPGSFTEFTVRLPRRRRSA